MKIKKVKRQKHYEPLLKVNCSFEKLLDIAIKTKNEKKPKKKRK